MHSLYCTAHPRTPVSSFAEPKKSNFADTRVHAPVSRFAEIDKTFGNFDCHTACSFILDLFLSLLPVFVVHVLLFVVHVDVHPLFIAQHARKHRKQAHQRGRERHRRRLWCVERGRQEVQRRRRIRHRRDRPDQIQE